MGGGVDSKSVAMYVINKGYRKNCIALDGFTTSRVTSDRSNKHAYFWYGEGTYNPYFQSPNLDWYIINKTDRQYMLIFLSAPLFSVSIICLWLVFLNRGLNSNGTYDAITNFIFTHLYNTNKENVAGSLTGIVWDNIKGGEVAIRYTSGSNWKVVMTKNIMHQDLSMQDK